MKECLISVNVTTYNRGHLLKRCLDSVINQTYTNLEIIIVDDCSTDNTCEIVKKYQAEDHRIKYYSHETNKGLAHARNTAVSASNGDFIALMDDDDEWLDCDKITKQMAIFNKYADNKNLGVVCSSVRLFSSINTYEDKVIVIDNPTVLASKMLYGNGIIYSPTVLMKKSLFESVGGYDTRLTRGIDSDLFRMAILKYNYDIHIMRDVTTGVHEYGSDRITKTDNINSLLKDSNTHMICLNKFKDQFNKNKTAKRWRKKLIIKNQVKLFILTKNIIHISRLLKVMFK